MTPAWMRLADESAAPSPALLVFPDRIEENLRRMIALALAALVDTASAAPIDARQRAGSS